MNILKISEIKPDPNQPRRTFNEEKMDALVASMKTDGFRPQYPIVVDGKNIIVDGERRWRSAKKAGIKEVPAEVRENVTDYERLMYQLQSEGAELETADKYEAWSKAYDLGVKIGKGYLDLSKVLGIKEDTIKRAVTDYKAYEKVTTELKSLGFESNIGLAPLAEIGREKDDKLRKELATKAVEEDWDTPKAREIRRAIKEKPLRTKQILNQDYSGDSWKGRLEVAKSDIDIKASKDRWNTYEHLEGQVDAYERVLEHGLKFQTALKSMKIDTYNANTRKSVLELVTEIADNTNEFVDKLVQYMIANGELTPTKKKLK